MSKKANNDGNKLNERQEMFCQRFTVHFTGNKAAIEAGYSDNCASVTASKLLKKQAIKDRVRELMAPAKEKAARERVTRDQVIDEFGRIGLSDVRKLYNEDGSLKDVDQLDEDTAAAIESIEVVTTKDDDGNVQRTHKYKLASKNTALRNLGQHFNIYEDHQKSGTGEIHVHIDGVDAKL